MTEQTARGEAVRIFTEAWEAKRAEIGRGNAPAGTKVGAGIDALIAAGWSPPAGSRAAAAPAPLEQTVKRSVSLSALLQVFEDGDEHGWHAEFDDLWHREGPAMDALSASIHKNGMQTPILLGSDGRVWDGHHRLAAAFRLGLSAVPVEFAVAPVAPEQPSEEAIAEAINVHRWKDMGIDWCSCECGEVLRGDGSLAAFPADAAFRMHLASVIAALVSSPSVETETPDGETIADPIPRYAQLDVWMALYGADFSSAFEEWRDRHSFAEAWARLVGGVRENASYKANHLAALPSVPTPTVEEWSALMLAERARQIEKGYTAEHDRQHGVKHLLNWAVDYARRGKAVESSTLIYSALTMREAAPTVEQIEARRLAAAKLLDRAGLSATSLEIIDIVHPTLDGRADA